MKIHEIGFGHKHVWPWVIHMAVIRSNILVGSGLATLFLSKFRDMIEEEVYK
jgi:hypothetical protein